MYLKSVHYQTETYCGGVPRKRQRDKETEREEERMRQKKELQGKSKQRLYKVQETVPKIF